MEPVDQDITSWLFSRDWFRYALDRPLISEPGVVFGYNTGLTHLLSGVLTKATGMSTKDFADRFLFGPLEITNYRWETDPNGCYGGGHLLHLTPRDMAKLGCLYLKQGDWLGRQIIPEGWVAESTKKQVIIDNREGYGYLWWVFEINDSSRQRSFSCFAARGYGGQHIIVVPELSLVVVITSNPNLSSRDGSDPSALVAKFILPAVK